MSTRRQRRASQHHAASPRTPRTSHTPHDDYTPTADEVRALRAMSPDALHSLTSDLTQRLEFASRFAYYRDGMSFGGKRDMYRVLGYPRVLRPAHYRDRYYRGGITARIVEAYPRATWYGGADITETDDASPDAADATARDTAADPTDFEIAFKSLVKNLNLWSELMRADILKGLGQYAVIIIGAPGDMSTELPRLRSVDDILYIRSLPEDFARILSINKDTSSPRFGQPEFYQCWLGTPNSYQVTDSAGNLGSMPPQRVHWSRIIHLAEGCLLDNVYGKPTLRPIWNLLDDLDKIVGGGAEAAWKRMDPGMQIDIDPSIRMTPDEEDRLDEKLEAFQDGESRTLQTKGTKINMLAAQVSQFAANQDAIVHLLSASTGLPHRILTGSERGEQSSMQDRDNWSDRVSERRREYGVPTLRCVIDRLQTYGALPEVEEYDVSWPDVEELNEAEKATIAFTISQANAQQAASGGTPVMSGDEIRDEVYGKGPLEIDEEVDDDESAPIALPITADPNAIDPTSQVDPSLVVGVPVPPVLSPQTKPAKTKTKPKPKQSARLLARILPSRVARVLRAIADLSEAA